MRVVYLADAPYVHTQKWVRHFAGLGWDTHVISFRPADIPGVTVHHVDGLETIGKARYVVHARRVRSMVQELEPDLLHALHLTSYGFLAGLSGFQPSIASVWGTDVLEAPYVTPLHRWITKHALAHAGAVTATGLRLAEATLPFMPEGKGVSVIPYGVDVDQFHREPGADRTKALTGPSSSVRLHASRLRRASMCCCARRQGSGIKALTCACCWSAMVPRAMNSCVSRRS